MPVASFIFEVPDYGQLLILVCSSYCPAGRWVARRGATGFFESPFRFETLALLTRFVNSLFVGRRNANSLPLATGFQSIAKMAAWKRVDRCEKDGSRCVCEPRGPLARSANKYQCRSFHRVPSLRTGIESFPGCKIDGLAYRVQSAGTRNLFARLPGVPSTAHYFDFLGDFLWTLFGAGVTWGHERQSHQRGDHAEHPQQSDFSLRCWIHWFDRD